jgi:hypothetical protein
VAEECITDPAEDGVGGSTSGAVHA